jgi:Carboxypeptidase regulatory-like domain/TonB dependent receptor/TonB-dependent Receptor Plug Domain
MHKQKYNLYRTSARIVVSCAIFLVILLGGNTTGHRICSWMPAAYAQTSTATFSGTIVDENDAVVVGASVKVTNTGTGLQRLTTSNSDGLFTLPLLPPGNYTVEVRCEGFSPAEIRNLVLEVGDQITRRIRLKVSGIGESIIITSGEGIVRESASVGVVVNRQFVENLPLNGRSFQSLIELTPGVVPTVTAGSEQGQFSVNGQRANANYFMVDGVSANVAAAAGRLISQSGNGSLPSLSTFGSTNNLVSIDALQEFNVLTSTYAPEYGRTPGAQISIVTRSGTNSFHGTLFNYFRNDVLDANDWFANANGLPKPALRQNDFGGTFGGPILLPRFGRGGRQPWYNGRDQTFFFFSYEGLRLRQPQVGITDVPSLSTRQNAPNILQPYLNAFPLPNGPESADTGLAKFSASYSNPSTLNATSIRIDHTLNSKSTLFGRYNHAPSETTTRSPLGAYSLNALNPISSTTQTITIGYTFIPTPNVTNELRFNYSRAQGKSALLMDEFGGAVVPDISPLLPSTVSPQESQISLKINSGLSSGFIIGNNNALNQQRQFNIVDNLSKVLGTHSLKLGIDYRRLNPFISSARYTQFVNFADTTNLHARSVSSASIISSAAPREPIYTNLSLYGQDTWHLSSRLTLTYGVRWEYNPPPSEANDNQAFTVNGLDDPSNLALAPRGTPLYKTTYNNFAPRFGMSYLLFRSPGRETVIRGGAGLFYDLANGQISEAYNSSAFGFGSTHFLPDASNPQVLFPLDESLAQPLPISTSPPVRGTMSVADPNLKLPYTLQWNFAIEQSLNGEQTISASYIGAAGRRLIRQELLFNPNIDFPDVLFVIKNAATSDYHALQLQYQRRLSRGLQALVSYTWGHSIDDISVENPAALPSPAALTLPRQDRGSSDFDVRHNFSSAVTYDLPIHARGTLVNALLRHWSVGTMIKARSATPVSLIGNNVVAGGFNYNVRPDLIPGVPIYINDNSAPGGRLINRAAFAAPPGNQQGTLGRNVVRGFPYFQTDLILQRQFKLRERLNLQLRADFFNIFNHPNFGNPETYLPDKENFGRSVAMFGRSLGSGDIDGGFNPLYQSGGPRSIQLSLKLQF